MDVDARASFWSWNAVLLASMLLSFAPTSLSELIAAVHTRTIPARGGWQRRGGADPPGGRAGNRGGVVPYDVVDGYVWQVVPPKDANVAVAADDGFDAFAAPRLILAKMVYQRGALGELDTLDYLHATAVEHGVVTPYSSMIVLVNYMPGDCRTRRAGVLSDGPLPGGARNDSRRAYAFSHILERARTIVDAGNLAWRRRAK